LFRRSRPAGIGAQRARQPAFFGRPLAFGDRFVGLLVEGRGDPSRAPLLGDSSDDDRPAHLAEPDLDDVAWTDLLRWFRALAVQVHPAADDGLGRRGTRLEEARRPDPLVNADAFQSFPSPWSS
jgi:hypothetical protein